MIVKLIFRCDFLFSFSHEFLAQLFRLFTYAYCFVHLEFIVCLFELILLVQGLKGFFF